jgi:electron-transferring-flavoprotein dehydrogenase
MNHYGGSFIYAMSDTLLSIGLASALAYEDPRFDPHGAFQQLKTHPWIASLLKGGKMVKYGAKTISEGGHFAIPQLYHDGLLLIGEGAGFLNSMRLKGIHLALKSGIVAAKTAFKALEAQDYSAAMLSDYDRLYRESWVWGELWRVRNFHQGYEKGLITGLFHTVTQMATGGRGLSARLKSKPDHLHMRKLSELPQSGQAVAPKFDGVLTFDKVSDVYASGTKHEENQPAHLKVQDTEICAGKCATEYGNPCQYFCPAQVYEMVEAGEPGTSEIQNRLRLQINASNCVHCKTCDIADPYGIITWTVPEGGGGPVYGGM